MNDAVMIQQASGSHIALLDLQREYNARYANRHHMDYWCIDVGLQNSRHCVWDKIIVIIAALRSLARYRWLFWVDADTIISRPDVDLRMGLSDGKALGMVIHPGGFHFNAGVIFMQNTPSIHRYFEAVWASWPVHNPWEEQLAMIRLILHSWMEEFEIMPAQWNSAHYINPSNHPVIRAWHGVSTAEGRINEMRVALEEAQFTEKQLVENGILAPYDADTATLAEAHKSTWTAALAATVGDLTRSRV